MASHLKLLGTCQNIHLTVNPQIQRGRYGRPKRNWLNVGSRGFLPCPALPKQAVAIWLAFSAAGFSHFSRITQPHCQSPNMALAWEQDWSCSSTPGCSRAKDLTWKELTYFRESICFLSLSMVFLPKMFYFLLRK